MIDWLCAYLEHGYELEAVSHPGGQNNGPSRILTSMTGDALWGLFVYTEDHTLLTAKVNTPISAA